jgi:hypothetical protein
MGDPAPVAGAPPVIQYWHAEEAPGYVDRVADSIKRHNPDSQYMLFNESTAGAFIEEHFTARELAAFQACAVPSMQSDYFRYCAVYALGGVYADLDLICTGSFGPLVEEAEGQLFRRPLGIVLNGFFAFRSSGHPFLRLTLDVVTANIERRESEYIAGVTGPLVLTGLAVLYELGSFEAFFHVCASISNKWQPKVMGEIAGDFDRVIEAFDGVRLAPTTRLPECISNQDAAHTVQKAAMLADSQHWTQWGSSIYR